MRLPAIATMFLLIVLLAPAGAGAAQSTAPPGNSGISQYVEVVPSSTGGKPTKGGKPGPSPLTRAQQRELARAGSTGRQLANVVALTSPPVAGAAAPASGKAGKHKSGKGGASSGDVKQAAAVAAAYGGGSGGSGGQGTGIGVPLIVLMGAAAAVVGGIALARRGGAGTDAEPEL
jgi:hypothetical protein